jgi:hypothetical protein
VNSRSPRGREREKKGVGGELPSRDRVAGIDIACVARVRIVLAGVLFAVFTSGGCRSTANTAPCTGPTRPIAGGDGPSLDELCGSVARDLCEQWSRCGCDDGSGGIASDACEARVRDACLAFALNDGVLDAMTRGTLVVSGEETSRFVEELGAATRACDPVRLDLSNCAIGRVPDEASCTGIEGAFSECLDGSSCWPNCGLFGCSRGPSDGSTCVHQWISSSSQGLGQRCFALVPSSCARGLQCRPLCGDPSWVEGVCDSPLALGAACRVDIDCASGFCHPAPGGSIEAFDFSGACAEARVLRDGAVCTRDTACASGHCDVPPLVTNDFTFHGGTCVAQLPDGAACTASRDCSSGTCGGAHVAHDVFSCVISGEPCGVDDWCSSGDACAQATVPGVCGTQGANGAPCNESASCASGLCVDDACVGRAGLGEGCSTRPCAEGLCSSGLVCVPSNRAIGEPCEGGYECESATCIAGACAPAVCAARIGPSGRDFYGATPLVLTPR